MNNTTFAEAALVALLERGGVPAPKPGSRLLVAGNRTGFLPLRLRAAFPEASVAVHAYDVHHARQIRDAYAEAGVAADGVVCSARLPGGPYDAAFFQTTPRSMPAELALDLLEDVYANLAEGACLFAAFEGDYGEALALLKKVFPKVGVLERSKHVALFRCLRRGELKKPRDFSAAFTASIPGGPLLSFASFPGCFCHRRPDAGGLALAEVAARDLKPEEAVLDMGCGCGLVGLLLADAQRRAGDPAPRLTMIDSHARAVAAATLNAANMKLDGALRTILADDGLPRGEAGAYDVFVGNPPYYSDYRIAEIFLETAYRALRPGGRCYTVVKTATGLKALQEKYFRTAEIVPRRGYAVLRSIR